MTTIQRIQEGIKAAMKAGDKARLTVLRSLLNDLENAGIEKKGEGAAGGAGPLELLSEEDVLRVLQAAAKRRRESIEQYGAGRRADLVAQEEAELAVIQEFLPQPLTDEEVEALVREVVAELGASGMQDMGRVMKEATARASGRADGKRLSGVVRRLLAEAGS